MIKINIFPQNCIHPFQLPLMSFLKGNYYYLFLNSIRIYFANKSQLITYQLQMFNPQKLFFSLHLVKHY